MAVFGFCILFLVSGIWRHQTFLVKIENSPIKNFLGSEIILIGFIDGEPAVKEKSTKLEIKLETGKVLITTRKYPKYQYGDKLKIVGKLESPTTFQADRRR